jgi:hypothetical protein
MMNQRSLAALLTGLLLMATSAFATSKDTVRITVLDSETRSSTTENGDVPKNCDVLNYDAYCHSSKTAEVINTSLVKEDDKPPFRIACTIESKWSRCIPLPKGETFDARKEKRGLTVYYQDDDGKPRKQLYTYVAEGGKGNPSQPASETETPPSPAASESTVPASTPAPSPQTPQAGVKCSFTSTPAGGEITLDGQYAGSTPSEISLSPGKHRVVVSMPGFAQWKRELTVSPGSELTVNAILQKAQ